MSVFKDHKITAKQILKLIPHELIDNLSVTTSIDHYSKVLQGNKMFYLLLYSLVENEKLSQRTLKDTFNDPIFKTLFSLDPKERICHSSISERLSKINADYFRQIYENLYETCANSLSQTEQRKHHIIRVDSTIVSDLSGRMIDGLGGLSKKKVVKYSVAFDGLLPRVFQVFTDQQYHSEDMALPELVFKDTKKETGHSNIYVIDRGLQSVQNMKSFSDNKITFIARLKENRRYVELESLMSDDESTYDLGSLILERDSRVNLYSGTKKANTVNSKGVVNEEFRLIVGASKSNTDSSYWFITNDFELSAKEVTDAYRKRWDIEVFFRFLKQEFNVRHLVSLTRNGIEVMLYMTLIAVMLVLLYKEQNEVGYKTAKRRFAMEIRNLAISMIVVHCGGDPSLYFKDS